MYSQLQQQALDLFNSARFSDLMNLIRSQPQQFPYKQCPVGGAEVLYSKPGSFGCRLGSTQYAVREGDHWVVFTISNLGDLTLNLHGCECHSVDWINATGSVQWVYKSKISQLDADLLVQAQIPV